MNISLSMPLSNICFLWWLGLSSNVLWAKCLPKGRMVAAGSPWTFQDTWGKKRAGKPLPCRLCRAVFAEVRADWKCMSEVFHLPHWQNTAAICCKCSATIGTFKGFSSLAPWRIERLNHWQFLERQFLQGKTISAIYHCPLFSTSCFKIDWLHTIDLGVSCDTLGNLCWHLLPKFPGKRSDQVAALFLTMKHFYTRNNMEARLSNLTAKMIRSSAKTSSRPGLVRPGHWYRGLWKLGRLCLISRILLSKQFFLPSSICTRPTNAWVRETSSTSISTMFVSIFFCNTKP